MVDNNDEQSLVNKMEALSTNNNDNNNSETSPQHEPIDNVVAIEQPAPVAPAPDYKEYLLLLRGKADERGHAIGNEENRHVLQTCMQHARRRQHRIALAFLFVTNIDEIPHSSIRSGLNMLELDRGVVDEIMTLCGRHALNERTEGEEKHGLTDGFSLRPILYNLAVISMLKTVMGGVDGYSHGATTMVEYCATERQICLMSGREDRLSRMLESLRDTQLSTWLTFNMQESRSFSFGNTGTEATRGQTNLRVMGKNNSIEFFGRSIGYELDRKVELPWIEVKAEMYKLDASEKTGVEKWEELCKQLPVLFELIRAHCVDISNVEDIEEEICKMMCKWHNIEDKIWAKVKDVPGRNIDGHHSRRARWNYVRLSSVYQIEQALNLLSSSNTFVRRMAELGLIDNVAHLTGNDNPTPQDIANYLNGTAVNERGGVTRTASRWTRLRIATRHLRNETVNILWRADNDRLIFTYNDEELSSDLVCAKLLPLVDPLFDLKG